jgi:hypothetical protein
LATIDLTAEVCKPCESGVPPLSEEQIAGMSENDFICAAKVNQLVE